MIGHHENNGAINFEKLKVFKPDSIEENKNRVFKSVTNLLQFTKKHSCPKIEADKYDEESAGKTLYSCIQKTFVFNRYHFWLNSKIYKPEINCNLKIQVCRYVFKKKFTQKDALKKVMGKKRSQIGRFYRFFGNFSMSHNFFSRTYAVLNFWYVVELVEFYRSVYFQVNRAIQIFWSFSWNTLPRPHGTWYFLFLSLKPAVSRL